ncbi:unnamed protein product, partial [Ectocarpus fasciculatus]
MYADIEVSREKEAISAWVRELVTRTTSMASTAVVGMAYDWVLPYNELVTLPAGIFGGLTALETLFLDSNKLTTLPERIFQNLTGLQSLHMSFNEFTALPEGIFQNLTGLRSLDLSFNEVTTLPEGIFGGLTVLEALNLRHNNLTALPEGIFQGLLNLTLLRLDGNSLECLPSTTLVAVDDDGWTATTYAAFQNGLHVDEFGDECGCSIEGVIDNVCGQENCTPGDEGYTCAATLAPVPAPALGTAAPESAPQPTPAPGSSSEAAATRSPAAAPALGTAAPESAPQPTPAPGLNSKGASMVGVVVGVMAGALALVALGLFLRRRRAAKTRNTDPPAPPSYGGDSLEHGQGEQHRQRQHDIQSSSPIIADSAGGNGTLGPPNRHDGAPSAAAPALAVAPAGGRRRTSSGVGYGQAILTAAEELAHQCQIPGVSEAAKAVSILIHLVLDSRDLTSRGDAEVKRCRSIVMMLERAAKVLGK